MNHLDELLKTQYQLIKANNDLMTERHEVLMLKIQLEKAEKLIKDFTIWPCYDCHADDHARQYFEDKENSDD